MIIIMNIVPEEFHTSKGGTVGEMVAILKKIGFFPTFNKDLKVIWKRQTNWGLVEEKRTPYLYCNQHGECVASLTECRNDILPGVEL